VCVREWSAFSRSVKSDPDRSATPKLTASSAARPALSVANESSATSARRSAMGVLAAPTRSTSASASARASAPPASPARAAADAAYAANRAKDSATPTASASGPEDAYAPVDGFTRAVAIISFSRLRGSQ
jgi:hypothetical protein